MAVTAQQIFNACMDLIDERLETGIISESDTKGYNVKSAGLLNIFQNEIMSLGNLYKTHEISNKPFTNILGYGSNFDIQAYEGTELTFISNSAAKAYYFEVDGEATVYIEDYTGVWNTLVTINVPSTVDSFTAYKGVVTPTTGATQSRIRFAGSYYYNTINRALFNIPFASSSKVPDYRPWVKKSLPSDFKSIDQIVNEFPERQYIKDYDYKWEGFKDYYLNYFYDGRVRIVYKPVPTPITALSQTMEIDDITAITLGPYFLAAHLLIDENSESAAYFNDRYIELKSMAMRPKPVSGDRIFDEYGQYGTYETYGVRIWPR